MQVDYTQNDPNSDPLSIYNDPVRNFLKENIKKHGHDVRDFSPVFDMIIREAKKKIPKEILSFPPAIILARIEEHAFTIILGILSQDNKIRGTQERIKSYGSVFLVGAGISFESGIPLTRVLQDLLKFCRASNYEELSKDKEKCLKFKREFGKICKKKEPSRSHQSIVINFPKYIEQIICLNWDNLIEKCGKSLSPPKNINKINEDIPVSTKNHIWKFHGDVDNIKEDNIKGMGGWVFPHEEGHVFKCFIDYIKNSRLSTSLFTFVIAGYSEREKEICDKIISLFEKEPPRPTFRVGLDLTRLHNTQYIFGPSDYILPKIMPLP